VGRVEKAEKKVIGLEIYSIKGNKKKNAREIHQMPN